MTVEPQCKYGHGKLIRQDGLWAFEGVVMVGQAPKHLLDDTHAPVPDGRAYVVSIWRCPVCSYVEAFDSE